MMEKRWIRTICVLAAALAAAALPAHAFGADTLSFGEQGAKGTFAANAIVAVDGSITYASDCPEPGIDDFFYPASDVYLVDAGSGSGQLQDVGGGRPNTIVAGASFFIGEVIALTAPGGNLQEGVYDVVYDTCQDGQLDLGRDTVFQDAVTVELPDVLPLVDGAIGAIKAEARSEYESWLNTRRAMSGIFKLADRALKVQCKTGNAVGCAMRRVDYFGGVKERFLTLLLSQANHYLAIAEDPPDPNFETLTEIGPIEVPEDHNDTALGNAVADALGPIAREAALSAALLHAVERYQGAQIAGDGEWALVHARQARNLAATLKAVVPATGDALDELRNRVAARATQLDEEITRGRAFATQVWSSGLTAAERRALRNQGLGATEIAELETELAGFTRGDGAAVDTAALLEALDDSRAAHTATASALQSALAELDEIVTALEADDTADNRPAIDAGGPYNAGEGETLSLQGSAAGAIDSAAWDLDGDGNFDDAVGLTPSASFPEAGAYVVGVRAVRDGREAISYAVVRVADANGAPILSAPVPAERSATVVVGPPKTFAVAASDPDGDPVSYAWRVDGAATGEQGASFTFSPVPAQVGGHVVEVIVSDGTPGGGATRRSWDVVVLSPDDDKDGWTATTDCDEADAAVHPSANELLGNGLDDDCDTGTPDAPPGGLTGSMLSWGSNHNGTIGNGTNQPTLVHSPVAIPGYDDVVQIAGGDRSGYAVLASGEVRGWGFNGAGNLGNGEIGSPRLSPVSPLPVGGGSGRLTGIAQISSSSHGSVIARRVDGTVVTWGDNSARQGGDGSTVNNRLFPVHALTSAGGPPLSGVRVVESDVSTNYALMNDGTVRSWGLMRCDGPNSIGIEPFPKELQLVGDDVRQVAAGGYWALFLKKDGTVLSCGANAPLAGRPTPPGNAYTPAQVTGLGPGSGVVDVSAGEAGLVLKEDGTVWTWGYNANGSLHVVGVPGGGSTAAPLQVPLPPGPPVVDVEMNDACHALALRADGSLLSWGCDFFGQAGDGANPTDWIVETPTVIDLGGRRAFRSAGAGWNSLVITRPADDTWEERPATWVKASVEDAAVTEGGDGRFKVSLSAEVPHDVTVEWSLVGGTAGGADVTLGNGTATVPAGSKTVEVDVPVLDDTLDEDAETFTIVLREASNGIRLERSQATGTIEDDDGPPTLTIQPAGVTEGHTSLADATLSVQLSQPSGKPVSVTYATADGEATAPGDYRTAAGKLLFQPGQQQAAVHVAVRGDSVVEPGETLSVSLTEPENATLGDESATLTISDDEPLALGVSSPTVPEGNDGTTPATFTVELEPAPPAGTTVSIDYEVEGLTAEVPGDVSPAEGTLVFGPGAEHKQVLVDVVGDDTTEPDEAFRLVLSNPTASDGRLVLPGDSTIATIENDDSDAPADSVAPTTTSTADPAPNDAGWNSGDVTVTLTAIDNEGGSGVKEIAYELSGAQTGTQTVAGGETSVEIAAEGTTTLTYFASDNAGNVETEKTLVVRIDKTAPSLSCHATPGVLRPANHKLVAVEVEIQGDDGTTGVKLTSVTSSEPDDATGTGDGSTVGDIRGFDLGTSDTAGFLRAERSGNGSGRVYRLTFTGRDQALNEGTCTTTVTVPHDQRRSPAAQAVQRLSVNLLRPLGRR